MRALYAAFSGPLYAVRRASDNVTLNISVLAPGGFADAAAQDEFCGGSACVFARLFDQSPEGNTLDVGPPGGARPHEDAFVNATRTVVTVGGGAHRAYGMLFSGGMGYRIDNSSGVAKGVASESIYMVTSSNFTNAGCCFDFGNAESNNRDDGRGTMEALNFGTSNNSHWVVGVGAGPHVMIDLENGLWAGGGSEHVNARNHALNHTFVTAMAKGGAPAAGSGFALKGGDARAGALDTFYEGPYPPRYAMKKQGSVILGIGGDNSNGGTGFFFEGAITAGYSTDATDAALQADVVAAGYTGLEW